MGAESESGTGTTLHFLLTDPGNPQAWERFVRRYGPGIHRCCRQGGLQEADADDVTQNVLAKLHLRMRTFSYDPSRSFRGWLWTVTENAWKDFLDDQHRAVRGSGSAEVLAWLHSVQAREDLQNDLEREYQRELLEQARGRVQQQVTPRDWAIFQALEVKGRPADEVQKEFRLSLVAVYKVKSRVLEKLRREIQRLEEPGTSPQEREP